HFYGDTNTLYLNAGNLSFQDATRGSGLGASSRQWLGFGTCFLDFDNDGWIDLFVANGHVDDRTWMPGGQPYRMPPQMYRNERNSTFLEVSAQSGDYFHQSWIGRGVACGDLDRDGRIDLAVSHQLAPSFALRNETEASGRSIRLLLVGVVSNRNGYTARVEVVGSVPLVTRELSGGGSFQSAHAPELHLGLGNRDSAEIHITWPSGIVDTHKNVETGDWIAIEGGRLWRIPSVR
ncbi:MAG TPA: CRTAC1 family protein, partial [Planctomycetaceae bacterium]|nr:CRTAC1 family protein [Planctomycetaceae bacterium]